MCRKKIVFGEKNSYLCLLNKSKSFGLKKKKSNLFFRTKKIGFLVKEKSDLSYDNKKNQICILKKKIRFVFICVRKNKKNIF